LFGTFTTENITVMKCPTTTRSPSSPYVSGSGLGTGHGSNGPSRIRILTILNAELNANSSCGNIGSGFGLGPGCALSENSAIGDFTMSNVIIHAVVLSPETGTGSRYDS
jgi:hypothetical protein